MAAASASGTAWKATTNLTKLAVAKNPHHTLGVLYSKTLRALAKMPENYAYRKYTENIIKERATLLKTVSNVLDLEKQINAGQIEEVIIQAENELRLSRKILEWKSWEPLEAEAPANQWKWPI